MEYELSKVGFPIRKSSDQSLFAAPQGLSQRTTSFIASQRQGIHRMPLRHLIVLMIDVRRSAATNTDRKTICLPNTSDFGTTQDVPPRPSGRSDAFPLHDDKEQAEQHPPSRKPFGRTTGQAAGNITNPKRIGGARRDRTDDLLNANQALSQLSYGPEAGNRAVGHQAARSQQVIPQKPESLAKGMVGLGRLERPTSPLSGVRSNHLSYRPASLAKDRPPRQHPDSACSSGKKEKRRRRHFAKEVTRRRL